MHYVKISGSYKSTLLFIDKDIETRRHFKNTLQKAEFLVETVPCSRQALAKLKIFQPEIAVICDVEDRRKLLETIQKRHPSISTVVAIDKVSKGKNTVVGRAQELEPSDYSILKPFDFDAVISLLMKIMEHRHILEDTRYNGEERRRQYRFDNFIGRNPRILDIFQKIRAVATTDSTVLITGETGTGKELVAEAIHYRSLRRDKKLIKVNCAALTETLINSELFGHEKGAFSGAISSKKGYLELADGGSIFLDEIGDIPIPTQIALLRVFDSGTFQRVGGTATLKVNIRFICATNKNLPLAIQDKIFREDLFYRINVIPIDIPALRERKSDIPLLANHFLEKASSRIGKSISRISESAKQMMVEYDWPGNVRELVNVIEESVVFCKTNEITPAVLPQKFHISSKAKPFSLTLTSPSLPEAESALIRKVLEESAWNLTQASGKLNIARGTLYSKIKKHRLEKPR